MRSFAKALSASTLFGFWCNKDLFHQDTSSTFLDAVGGTPLVELKTLSKHTGCRILVKAEHMNPGHNVKDRAAKWIIEEAEKGGFLVPGKDGVIVEGTGGNTGIGLAMMAASRGYRTIMTMPDYVSTDKQNAMKIYGAKVVLCPPVGFDKPEHFYHTAKRIAEETPNAFWANQFENLANFRAHYNTTAPEIWRQTGGVIDGICLASGTGGTIGGLSAYLKEKNPKLTCFLIDAPEMTLNDQKAKIFEGIGSMRVTANFAQARIDGAFCGKEQEALEMCFYLLRNEGLWVGPSSALNVVGAVKLARKLGPGKTVVTVLCDSGRSYTNTVYNPQWLIDNNLQAKSVGTDLSFVGDNSVY